MLWGDPLSYNVFTELDNLGSKVKNQTLGMDFNQDSSAVVIDMTTLFTTDEPLLASLPGESG